MNKQLSSSVGLLSIAAMLDRETTDVFHLNISVTDGGQPRHTTYTPLSVHIIDVNDNPPVFQRSVYVVDVSEGAGVGSAITTVHAIDKDTGMVVFLFLTIVIKMAKNNASRYSLWFTSVWATQGCHERQLAVY